MRRNAGIAILAGVIGTPVMTILMYLLAPVMGVNTDMVSLLAETLGGWRMGMLVHMLNGVIIFPLAFAFVLYRFISKQPLIWGVSFGVVLWLASQLVAMPLMGAGVFCARVGGITAATALLLGHLAYGMCLGVFPILLREEVGPERQAVRRWAGATRS